MGGDAAPLQVGNIPVAVFAVAPLGYRPDGTVELVEHRTLKLSLANMFAPFIKPQITRFQRYGEHSLVQWLVVNPERVLKTPLQLKKTRAREMVPQEKVVIPGCISRPASGSKRWLTGTGAIITR